MTRAGPRLRLVATMSVGVMLFVAMNVAAAAVRAATYPGFWSTRAAEPVPADAIRLVALGDSSVQAIGADWPWEGFVGRIAEHLLSRTGRPVHITNVSDGGATGDILRRQLPRVNLTTADLVIVADSNDMQNGVSLTEYRAVLAELVGRLPSARTVFSDLPPWPGRGPYQEVLREVTDAHHVARADSASVLLAARDLAVFSWLPPHLNSTGYRYWFEAFRPAVDRIIAKSTSATGSSR